MHDLNPAMRAEMNYQEIGGSAVINVTPGSPAEISGLKPGDIIVSYKGKFISDMTELILMVQRTRIGEKVPIRVWRRGNYLDLEATIVEGSASLFELADEQARNNQPQINNEILKTIGIKVRDLTISERNNGFRGVVITEISPSGSAAKVFQKGDLIFAINQQQVDTSVDFYAKLSAFASQGLSSIHLIRRGAALRVDLPKPK